ncbi:hypothetical protein ACS15_5690 [Ralstonia insidiosa]|uniref:Uncharacterized protein n=1 Tax=Ralstonia insidiosa TaxID=190721 RepID=A0AAC9BKR7_9RALS|nr:hypothetical protein ACS15_5690 [Ralstonia insidiosa]
MQVLSAGGPPDQAAMRNNQPPLGKMQPWVQIQLQSGQDGFLWSEA